MCMLLEQKSPPPQARYKASYRIQDAKLESSAGTAGLAANPSLLGASPARRSSNLWARQLSKHLPVMTNTFQVPSSAAPSSVHRNRQTAAFLPSHIYTWTCWPLLGVWASPQPRTRLCKLLLCFNRYSTRVLAARALPSPLFQPPTCSSKSSIYMPSYKVQLLPKQRGKSAAFIILQWGFSQHEAAS